MSTTLVLKQQPLSEGKFSTAFTDVVAGAVQWRLWLYLAWIEIKLRYRRSILGPWWITLSVGIFILSLGIVYSRLFHQDFKQYLPYLVTGYILWTFISTCIVESLEVFNHSGAYIKQFRLPYSTYIYRLLTKNIFILGHSALIYVITFIYCKVPVNLNILYFLPGFLLVGLNLMWCSLLLGMLAARYRDVLPIVTSVLQVIFFISPIAWRPEFINESSKLIKLNPIYYLIDLVRAPLLAQPPNMASWEFGIIAMIVGGFLTLLFFGRYRSHIPFWID